MHNGYDSLIICAIVSYVRGADNVWLALRLDDMDGQDRATSYSCLAYCTLSVILLLCTEVCFL